MSLFDINLRNLHHAYLLEGERESLFQSLLVFLNEDLNFSTTANPDFWLGDFDSLGIADSRAIKNFQSRRSFGGDKKILIIKTNFITQEAQNSLLKVFEEPTINTHLFLIIPSVESLLPTLKSRLTIVKNLDVLRPSQEFRCDTSKFSVGEFLEEHVTERFELIKVFLPKKKGEKTDKAGAINFLNELEKELYKKFKSGSKAKLPTHHLDNTFSEIRQCRSYLRDRSPSVKMILEHLSQIV